MATILTKRSNTASSVPVAGDLTNSTGGAELAVNTADKRLFTKDSGGTVVELGTNPSSVTLPNGTANGVPYLNGSKVLTSGSALTFDGTNFSLNGVAKIAGTSIGGAGERWIGSDGSTNLFINASTGNGVILGANNASIASASSGKLTLTSSVLTFSGTTVGSGSDNWIGSFGSSDWYFNAATGRSLVWGVNNSEAMRLTSTGLGIGTSSPVYKLTTNVTGGSATALFKTDQATADIYLQASGTSQTYSVGIGASGNALRFLSGASSNMLLDSSGNLGLGVTPSAWFTGSKVLQFGATGALWNNGSNNSAFSHNVRFTDSDARYLQDGFASYYRQLSGAHNWFTAPSGTAGAGISFTQAMTLDASGNLGIGTSSPSAKFDTTGTGTTEMRVRSQSSGNPRLGFWAEGSSYGYIDLERASGAFTFNPNSTERARITSGGDLLIGTTSNSFGGQSGKFFVSTSSGNAGLIQCGNGSTGLIYFNNSGTASYYAAIFTTNGSTGTSVGNIQVSSTATAYNTSSDYRLKNTIAPMTGALAKVALLKPCTYKWNADGSDGEGFIAHELAEVVPQCVTGEKDAVDAEGKPQYQGIDTSFLVATLTAAIQELKAEFDAYKASHP